MWYTIARTCWRILGSRDKNNILSCPCIDNRRKANLFISAFIGVGKHLIEQHGFIVLVNRWLLCVMLGIIDVPAKTYLVENGIDAVRFLIADLKAVFECCIFAVNVDIVGKMLKHN